MTRLDDTYIENRQRVQPNHANNYGTVHGGNVMKWMDEIGALSAMRLAGETCVTANIDAMDFIQPVPVGDTVLIESYVYDTGRTSVKVRLRAYREEPRTGEREQTTESRFVFVAVDDQGSPTSVPDVKIETDRERNLRDAALEEADDDE